MLRSVAWLAWTIVGYLLGAAACEFVLVSRHEASPHGEGWILLFALVAMLAGALLVARRVAATALFAPAAALFVAARFYTGDPYYGSMFRRYADGGVFAPTWIYILVGLALAAGLTTVLWRRTAPVEPAAALLALAFTALFMGTGH